MKNLKQLLLQEQGVAALYMALVLFVLLGMAGIALDGSNAYAQRRRMQTAADFAALAGARTLALGGDTAAIDAEVEGLALANGVGNVAWALGADGKSVEVDGAGDITVDWNYTANGTGIEVVVANNHDTFFAGLLGYDTLTATAISAAGYLPVVGVDNLLPLTVNACDCVDFDEWPATISQDDFGSSVIAVYTIGNINDGSINYTLYLKNLDPTYPGNTANRPYYMFYDPDDNGVFTVYGDGTAHRIERVVNVNGDGFLVELYFGGRTTTPPDGQSPVCAGACPTTTDWHYYPTITGTLTGLPGTRYAGAIVSITRRAAAMQVGTNAHLKNPQPAYGGAGWLTLTVIQQPTAGFALNTHNEEAAAHMVLLPLTQGSEPQTCALYPLALSTQTINSATPGATLGDIWNGTGPGNFGWLTWVGSPSTPTLITSLTPPGDSNTYMNPNNSTDRVVSVGDWVQGSPGVANASGVRNALDILKTMDITVPVWDQATGNGNNSLYRVAGFAIVRITDYHLPNQNRITATLKGYATNCGGGSSPPPSATPTPAPPTPTATPATGGACLVTYRVNNDWGSGFTADVIITNQTGTAFNGWSITWAYAGNQKITNLWNGALTQTGASVRVNHAAWNGGVNPGATVSFGFQATYSGANVSPTAFVVNGIACNGGASPTATPPPIASASPTPTPTATATPTTAPTPPPAPPTGSCALDDTVQVLNRYSLIVLNDLSTSSDIENRAFVGGSLVSSTSANIGINVSGIPASEPMFVVVGNLVAGNPLNLNAGSLLLGGNRNGRPINFNGGGALVQDPTLFATEITALLQSAAAQLATQPANNGVTLPTGQPGPARFTVTSTTPDGIAVFQVAAGDLFGNGLVQQIELNPGAASTVLINVTGSAVDWSGNGNLVGNFTNSQWRSRVLWNFPQASSIAMRSHNMMGAILAPYAQVTTAANLDGSVAVRALTTSAEVHQPTFSGNLGALCGEDPPAPTGHTPCRLAWLDWDGGLASNSELTADLNDPGRSGVRRVGEWVDAGPAVAAAQQVTHALDQWLNQPALIVLYDEGDQQNGYQLCGFAEFTLTDYDLAALPPWLQGQFSPATVRGLTDPAAPDYGLRDIRFK